VQSVYRMLSLPQRGRYVIEADLKCSELRIGARRTVLGGGAALKVILEADRHKQKRTAFPVPSFFSARSRHYSNIGQAIFFGLMLWALASRCPPPLAPGNASGRPCVPPAAGRTSFWFYAMADRGPPSIVEA
jgi:hypothetical protein